MKRRQLDIVAALDIKTMTADEVAAAAGMTIDLAYLYLSQLMRAGKVVITARRVGGEARASAKRPVNVYGLAGRDPVLTIVRAAQNEDDEHPKSVARRVIRKTAGSGIIAGPTYARGFANWGARRNSA